MTGINIYPNIAGTPASDHGGLAGLGDDDHALYPNLGAAVVTVAPSGGDYATLAAAMAAIADAAANKTYLIVVSGEITESGGIAGKSHVHVLFLPGACITLTANSTVAGVSLSGVVNSTWAAVDNQRACIVRAGAGNANALALLTCDGTVRLANLCVSNQMTAATAGSGIYISGGAPVLSECVGQGGAVGHGINLADSAPSMIGCEGRGGTGDSCYGIYLSRSSAKMIGCRGIGGAAGVNCYGIFVYNGSHAFLERCVGYGGRGGAGGYGLRVSTGCKPVVANCIGLGGGVDTQGASFAYASANDGRFQPGSTFPFRLVGVRVQVTGATAGGTVTIRDAAAGGGNALTAALSLASVAQVYAPVTGHRLIAAGDYLYCEVAGAPADGSFTVWYEYETCFATSYGLYHDSDSAVAFSGCLFAGNAASPGGYIANAGDDRSKFNQCVFRSGAVQAQSAWNPAQLYLCVFDGGQTNITAAAGTGNGTNVAY